MFLVTFITQHIFPLNAIFHDFDHFVQCVQVMLERRTIPDRPDWVVGPGLVVTIFAQSPFFTKYAISGYFFT